MRARRPWRLRSANWTNGKPIYHENMPNDWMWNTYKEATEASLNFGDPDFANTRDMASGNVTGCDAAKDRCPTSPHQFANTPSDTKWYTDFDVNFGNFPLFVLAAGVVKLQTQVVQAMQFDPFAKLELGQVPRVTVPEGEIEPVRVDAQEVEVSLTLSPQTGSSVVLSRDLIICPSSPLHWPPLTMNPGC